MNVLLLHLDGAMPNLALMRLAAHYRALGAHVELRRAEIEREHDNVDDIMPRLGDPVWDLVYGSLIFKRSLWVGDLARKQYPNLVLGGTGIDLRVRLADVGVDDDGPVDYAVYPSFVPSIGFAQRGCRLTCHFCVVPTKEGKVRPVATLEQIWRGGAHKKQLVLLDNDFFGNPEWRERIAEAVANRFALAVIQGINVRKLTDEQAQAIASVRWMAGNFSRRRVYTAWDGIEAERAVFRGLDRLKAAGISPDDVMVYMLIGDAAGETHADRDHRRRRLREWGARPYPMPITRAGELGEELCAFQSWCLQRQDLHVPWEKWWGRARGEPRKLGDRRVSLPLFVEDVA